MGMGGGMSPADVMQYQLLQAKGELKTLEGLVATTQKSIETLEQAVRINNDMADRTNTSPGVLLSALVETNLIQLRANLLEGTERITYLKDSISKMESPLKKAHLIRPGR